MKLKSILFIVILACYSSCSQIPCFETKETKLFKFTAKNNSAPWNCGLLEWGANQAELDSLCALFGEFSNYSRINVQVSRNLVDIFINDEREKLFRENMVMLYVKKHGYIFIVNNNYYYKNEKLAEYLTEKMMLITYEGDTSPCNGR